MGDPGVLRYLMGYQVEIQKLDNCVTARLDIQAASWSAEEQNRALQFRDNAWLHKPYRTMPING